MMQNAHPTVLSNLLVRDFSAESGTKPVASTLTTYSVESIVKLTKSPIAAQKSSSTTNLAKLPTAPSSFAQALLNAATGTSNGNAASCVNNNPGGSDYHSLSSLSSGSNCSHIITPAQHKQQQHMKTMSEISATPPTETGEDEELKKAKPKAMVATPEQVMSLYMNKLTPYEHHEIYKYKEIYFIGANAKKRPGIIGPNNSDYDNEQGSYIQVTLKQCGGGELWVGISNSV